MTTRWRADRADRGAATVVWLTAISLVLVLGLVGIAMTELASGRAKAAAAADLGALAGAEHVLDGTQCAVARRIVAANGATLTRCSTASSDVEVQVAVSPGKLLTALAARAGNRAPRIKMTARAGAPQRGAD